MRFRSVALAGALAAALVAPARAAGPADASIPGLKATGNLVVRATVQGSPITVGGNVALYHRGLLYRLDILSLGFPGTSGDLSAVAATLIGQGGVSVLYDGSTGTLTAWSNRNRTYYTESPRPAAPAAAKAPAVPAAPSDPLAGLAAVSATLRNVQTATIQLVDHAPVNGHPATNLDIQMRRQLPGKALENYHAQISLADDLDAFPLRVTLQSTPATKNAFGGTARLDLTSVQRDDPGDGVFAVPQGYTRVDSLAGVLRT